MTCSSQVHSNDFCDFTSPFIACLAPNSHKQPGMLDQTIGAEKKPWDIPDIPIYISCSPLLAHRFLWIWTTCKGTTWSQLRKSAWSRQGFVTTCQWRLGGESQMDGWSIPQLQVRSKCCSNPLRNRQPQVFILYDCGPVCPNHHSYWSYCFFNDDQIMFDIMYI